MTYGPLFISRADNEGNLNLPSFSAIQGKLGFCAPSCSASMVSRSLLNQRKLRLELGVLERPGKK